MPDGLVEHLTFDKLHPLPNSFDWKHENRESNDFPRTCSLDAAVVVVAEIIADEHSTKRQFRLRRHLLEMHLSLQLDCHDAAAAGGGGDDTDDGSHAGGDDDD